MVHITVPNRHNRQYLWVYYVPYKAHISGEISRCIKSSCFYYSIPPEYMIQILPNR